LVELKRNLVKMRENQLKNVTMMRKSLSFLRFEVGATKYKSDALETRFIDMLQILIRLTNKFELLKQKEDSDSVIFSSQIQEQLKIELKYHRLETIEKQSSCNALKSRVAELEKENSLMKDELRVSNERRVFAEQRLEVIRDQAQQFSSICF